MKRGLLLLVATVVGLVLVVGYKPKPAAAPTGGGTGSLAIGNGAVAGAQTVVGTDEQLSGGLGDIQVQITAANNRIVAVSMASMNLHGPQSRQIASTVIPQLLQETMATNGGPIHAVSGATYTAEAYQRSLQAALDKLRGGPNAGLATSHGNSGVIPAPGGHDDDDGEREDD